MTAARSGGSEINIKRGKTGASREEVEAKRRENAPDVRRCVSADIAESSGFTELPTRGKKMNDTAPTLPREYARIRYMRTFSIFFFFLHYFYFQVYTVCTGVNASNGELL